MVRLALRREMVLALMRLWDKRTGTIRFEHVAQTLKKASVIEVLAIERARDLWDKEEMRRELEARANRAISLIEAYSRGGGKHAVRDGPASSTRSPRASGHEGADPSRP